MSDSAQTMRGKSFWAERMADAVDAGMKAGLVDLAENIIDWYDPHIESFNVWLKEREDAWGFEDAHKDFRFLISR